MFDDIEGFEWLPTIEEKLLQKHGVNPQEAEECFFNPPFKVGETRKASIGFMDELRREGIFSSCMFGMAC